MMNNTNFNFLMMDRANVQSAFVSSAKFTHESIRFMEHHWPYGYFSLRKYRNLYLFAKSRVLLTES